MRPSPLLLTVVACVGCRGKGAAGSSPAGPDVATATDAGSTRAPCESPAVADPRWYHDVVGYEVFVRSFADSDSDGIGDLRGLTERLDYLNDGDPGTDRDLGVDVLWLMPILESPSYHGYDATDYERIDPEYGDDAALDALFVAAEERGIRVLLDLVLNHTSASHPWFSEAASSAGSPRRGWYVWSARDEGWSKPWGPGATWHHRATGWYYGLFSSGMPDLNLAEPAVRQRLLDVAEGWVERGFSGFRLDAVRYLVETSPGPGQADTAETHAYLRSLRDRLGPDAFLVGEAWTDGATVAGYFGSEREPELHSAFDFDGADALLSSIARGRAGPLKGQQCGRYRSWPAHALAGQFLTNHDLVRVATELAPSGPAALRLAAVALFSLPGMPWIYYGEELGMANGTGGGDEAKRLPMQWAPGRTAGFSLGRPWREPRDTAAPATVEGQTDDPDSLLSLYRQLIRLRRELAPLRRGSARFLPAAPDCPGLLTILRELGDERVTVALNFAPDACVARLAAADLPGLGPPVDAITDEPLAPEDGGELALLLEGRGWRILRARAGR